MLAVWKAIIALMPPHDTYIEPFLGTGAIFHRKGSAARSILLDLDPRMTAISADRGAVEVLNACALEFLAALDIAELGRVVIYCDPPYVLSTRTSDKRYRHDFTDQDHVRLAAALRRLAELGASVIVSGYPSPLYDQLFAGWNTWETQVMTRGGVRTEKLWFSFEPGYAHQATYAGENFTRRQNIKRKAERWVAKFLAMGPAERQAVLAALLAAEISHS